MSSNVILSSTFTQSGTEFSSQTSSTYVAGSSSLTTASISAASQAATQAGCYLGYLALLCANASNPPSGQSASTTAAIKSQITTIYNQILNLEGSFSGQSGSDYQNLVSDINNLKTTFGSSATPTSSQMSAYVSIYEGANSTTSSPVSDILDILNNEAVFNTNTSSDTYFAVSMFLLSGNLPGILSLGLSGDLENILNSPGADPSNPAQSASTWMAEFLSAYVNQTGNSVNATGNVLAAILPSQSSSTPNYNNFYQIFTGAVNSPASYANWGSSLPANLTAAEALKGISFWYLNILPSQGS